MRVKNISKDVVILGACRLPRPKELWADPNKPELVECGALKLEPGEVKELADERLGKYDKEDLKALVPAPREKVSLPEPLRPIAPTPKPSQEELEQQKDDEAMVKLLSEVSK